MDICEDDRISLKRIKIFNIKWYISKMLYEMAYYIWLQIDWRQ
jgi:hypothetical protein